MEYDVLMADGEAAANAGKPITDVIFDFGNVLIYWDPVAVMTPRYSDELVEQFLDNDISGFYDVNDELDYGMSNDDGVALMRERYGDKWADMLQYYLDNFVDSLTGVVPGARVLINDLKAAGVHVWGLSNWQKDLFPIALDNFDILRSLNDRVVSGYVFLAQAATSDIYEFALQQFGIDASGAVFVDDKAMNIVGANECRHSRRSIQGFACVACVAHRCRCEDSCSAPGIVLVHCVPLSHTLLICVLLVWRNDSTMMTM